MKRQHLFLTFLSLIFILFAVTATYTVMKDNDPYRHFTGLGSTVSVAPDDSSIAVSYYANGEESIYTMNPDGTNVQRITNQVNVRNRNPSYSPDGTQIVYMSENQEHTQTLKIVGDSGNEGKALTESDLHVRDAIFSMDGETIFFVAIEAAEFHKGEESREGFDLYSIKKSGTNLQKLTDADHFSMNQLFLSSDSQIIYYSEFDGQEERIYAYLLENETIDKQPSLIPAEVASGQSFYSPQLSPDGNWLAYKAVANESQETSLFEYELFTLNLADNNVEKLTDFGKSLSSPVFFHNENKIVFLENTNWAKDPATFQLMTINLENGNIQPIEWTTPEVQEGNLFLRWIDQLANAYTVAILYILLFGLLSAFCHHYYPRKTYLPSIISFVIAVLTFLASIVMAMIFNAWFGIGLSMLSFGIFVCSVIVVIFTLIYKRLARRT